MTDERFAPYVESELRRAGWFPGRRISDQVCQWMVKLCGEFGYEAFPLAVQMLEEFGGLSFDGWSCDRPGVRSGFGFNPLAVGGAAALKPYMKALGERLFPLGCDDQAFDLAIGESGRVVFVGSGSVILVGQNIDDAINVLIRERACPEILTLKDW
jgi:hypothetical protein